MHRVIYRYLVLALIALLPTLSFGEEIDRLLGMYDETTLPHKAAIANKLMDIFNEEGLTDGPLHFAPTASMDELNRQVWYWSAEHFYATQEYDQAIAYGRRALPLCEKTDMEADCLNLLALSCFRTTDYVHAVEYAKRCYELDKKTGDPDVMSSSLNTIAGIYLGANQPQEAEQYILEAIEMAKQADNPARMAVLQGTASEIYHAMKNDEKALDHINAACDIERTLGRDDKLAVRLTQKASVLNGLKRYDEAEHVLAEAIPQLRQTGDAHSLAIAYNKMGTALYYQQRQREAIGYFNQAAEIFMDMGDIANEMHSRRGLYESYWDINPDSARINLNRFDLLKDSLYAHASAADLARYNAEFGVERLQQENKVQRTRALLWIAGLAFIAILVILLVWILPHRQHKKQQLMLQTIIDELQVHDAHQGQEPASPNALHNEDREFLMRLTSHTLEAMESGEVSVEKLAETMCVTRGHLNRRVKAITGATTQQYVLRTRLEHARELLTKQPELPVAEIAYKCAFDDATSFSRAFRRTFGQSPSHYRNAAN